jgi:transposase
VRRIDRIFDAERAINGVAPDRRLASRHRDLAPPVAELERWMRAERARLSRHNEAAKAMDYMLKRWEAFPRFLEDGRICLTAKLNDVDPRAWLAEVLGRIANHPMARLAELLPWN